jgi:hypothetical protein
VSVASRKSWGRKMEDGVNKDYFFRLILYFWVSLPTSFFLLVSYPHVLHAAGQGWAVNAAFKVCCRVLGNTLFGNTTVTTNEGHSWVGLIGRFR